MIPPVQFPEGEISCDELPQEIKVTKTYILGSSINLEASTPMGMRTQKEYQLLPRLHSPMSLWVRQKLNSKVNFNLWGRKLNSRVESLKDI